MAFITAEEPMRNISYTKNILGIAVLLGSLVVGVLTGGVSEAQKIPIYNRDVVLVDCVEDTNAFVVQTVSSTLDVDITQGMDCAAAVKKLLARGFVLGQGTGGATSGLVASLNHFLMIFVLNTNSLIEEINPTSSLNPSQGCILGPNLQECNLNTARQEPLTPTLNSQGPLTPIFQSPLTPTVQSPLTPTLQSPLTPTLQMRNP